MPVILILAGCAPGDPRPSPPPLDTSYQEVPVLERVAVVSCDEADGIVFEARTVGWHESAVVDMWADPADPRTHTYGELASYDFSADEFCDAMRTEPIPLPEGATCATVTWFVRVNYEEGCAGCVAGGPNADGIGEGYGYAPLSGEDCPVPRGDHLDPADCAPVAVGYGSVGACR